MNTSDVVLTTDIPGLKREASGKVRDIYRVGPDELLLVATDRISAFDVVLGQGIPDKGRVLTRLSVFWFEKLGGVIPNHFLTADDDAIIARIAAAGVSPTPELRQLLRGRSMLCRRTEPLPIEAVVRGYLSGSAWKAYCAASSTETGGANIDLWGVNVPAGLRESEELPAPVFTPSTKPIAGHDLPMRQSEITKYIGAFAAPVRDAALRLYREASRYAQSRGIIIADTKFEFGVIPGPSGDPDDRQLLLIDEALTPDSSRFWNAAEYTSVGPQPSFDKQFVRDYLLSVQGWNQQAPAPDLPSEIIERTAEKYRDAYLRITGKAL